MMKKGENKNTDQKSHAENNQKKIIAQNNKIINLLERINSNLVGIHRKRQS